MYICNNFLNFSRADCFRAMVNESIDHENDAISNATRERLILTISQPKIKPILLIIFYV